VAVVALDTNVLVYAEGIERSPGDAAKVVRSRAILSELSAARARPIAPLQMLAELHRVLVRRAGLAPEAAGRSVERWANRMETVSTNASIFAEALSLSRDHALQVFDAIILAAAGDAGCDALLSEDMHDGFVWRGVEVINPFQPAGEARLARLLATQPPLARGRRTSNTPPAMKD
jgi:predicted nucleic acid-binding protein